MDEEKDSYDRQDSYNAQGIAAYVYLNFKSQIDTVFSAPEPRFNLVPDSNAFINYHKF